MSTRPEADVVVVGAGLAGLRCAVALRQAGLDVVVLEAAEAVGGRIRTDRVDGFLLDRGFQLLNPAYPAVRRWVDVAALGLQPFGAGVAARTEDGTVRLGHPLRAPALLGPSARTVVRRPGELLAAARLVAPLLAPRRGRTLSAVLAERGRPDAALGAALDRVGLDGLLRRVVERFLAGVVLEDRQETSEEYVLLLLWMFLRGVPALPREGMQALPTQLAALLDDRVRLDTPVTRVRSGEALTTAGTVRGRAVVVATGGRVARDLTGVAAPGTRGVVTAWWAVEAAEAVPARTGLLHVDARERPSGPLVNCAVVSDPAPSYAPPGRHLVQASAILADDRPVPTEPELRRHAADLLGDPDGGRRWRELAVHRVPDALPAQPPPYSPRRPVVLEREGVLVCGDHRDTASIQGALVSGQRAAEAVLASLGATRR